RREPPRSSRAAEQRDELAPFHQQFLPCFEAEDSTAGDLLHCGISGPSMSALGQERTSPAYLAMSALPLKADKAQTCWHVRFVPKADISANSIVHTPQRVPTSNRMASILGQGEDRAWGRDSAKYMRSECDQRHLGLGGKRA